MPRPHYTGHVSTTGHIHPKNKGGIVSRLFYFQYIYNEFFSLKIIKAFFFHHI